MHNQLKMNLSSIKKKTIKCTQKRNQILVARARQQTGWITKSGTGLKLVFQIASREKASIGSANESKEKRQHR
jgi:hypothetical protein